MVPGIAGSRALRQVNRQPRLVRMSFREDSFQIHLSHVVNTCRIDSGDILSMAQSLRASLVQHPYRKRYAIGVFIRVNILAVSMPSSGPRGYPVGVVPWPQLVTMRKKPA